MAYLGIFMKGFRKTIENVSQDRWHSSWDSNWTLPSTSHAD
jgi:hypothetical protein